jgi:signal transduction histidine kinase
LLQHPYKHYNLAVSYSTKYNFQMDRALSLELSGIFYFNTQLESIGLKQLEMASQIYNSCNARAKAQDIEAHFPMLDLYDYNQKNSVSIMQTIRTSDSYMFDLPSIVKLSQAISSETNYDQLLKKVIKILLQNAGAQKAALVIIKNGEPYLEVAGIFTSGNIQMINLHPTQVLKIANPIISKEVISHVLSRNEMVLLEDAGKSGEFSKTKYIVSKNIKSIMCIPLSFQGNNIGVICLENNLVSSAFTSKQVEIIQLIATQISISIINAIATRKQKNTELKLLDSQRQIRIISQHQEKVRHEEQKRIAREIHDELGGNLTRVKLDLDLLQDSDRYIKKISSEDVAILVQLVDQTLNSTRRIATNLHPKILDQFGILAALEWQAQKYKNHFTVQVNPKSSSIRMNETKEMTLFRIGQEAITNIAKHANCNSVYISLIVFDETIRLEIQDDGKGINEDHKKILHDHMGVRGMKERTSQLGGTLEFITLSTGGTLLKVIIPRSEDIIVLNDH